MVTAAKTISQVAAHMSIAFGLAYALTGSVALGGVAALIEPVINVMLLPLHEKLWVALRRRLGSGRFGLGAVAAEKISQTGMHMAVAFGVIYWATGSMASGGLLALLEPICNVTVLPFHDRLWERLRRRLDVRGAAMPSHA